MKREYFKECLDNYFTLKSGNFTWFKRTFFLYFYYLAELHLKIVI